MDQRGLGDQLHVLRTDRRALRVDEKRGTNGAVSEPTSAEIPARIDQKLSENRPRNYRDANSKIMEKHGQSMPQALKSTQDCPLETPQAPKALDTLVNVVASGGDMASSVLAAGESIKLNPNPTLTDPHPYATTIAAR